MSNYSPSGPTREQLIELAEMYGTADHSLDWDSSGNLVGPGVQYWPTQLDYEGEVLRRKLFGDGQQGLVFVPQPKVLGNQTLYQGSDGTTLTDAHGDPVGLGLEWSRGLELGPELVTNGTFDSDLSGWVPGVWQYDNGSALHEPTANSFDYIEQSGILADGLWYLINIEVMEIDGGRVGFSGNSFVIRPEFFTVGRHSAVVQGAGQDLRIYATGENRIAIDNISVRELPGNHLTQSVSADRPTYGTDGTLHWLGFDGADDHFNIPTLSFPGTLIVSFAIASTAPAENRWVLGTSANNNAKLGHASGSWFVRLVDGATSEVGVAADTGKHILTATRNDSDDVELFLDGVSQGVTNQPGTASFDLLFRSQITSEMWKGSTYGAVISEDASKRNAVESYLANLAGITL